MIHDKVGFSLDSQMSTDAQAAIARLRDSGLLKSKGLVGGKWVDSYDGKTVQVLNLLFCNLICFMYPIFRCFTGLVCLRMRCVCVFLIRLCLNRVVFDD